MPVFDFTLLHLGCVKNYSNWNFGPICSSFSRFYWMVKGEAYVTIAGRKHKLTPNHLYLIPALVSHYDSSLTPFDQYYIHFTDKTKNIFKYYHNYQIPFEIDINENRMRIILYMLQLFPNFPLHNTIPESYESPASILTAAKRFQNMSPALRMKANALVELLFSFFIEKAIPRQKVNDSRIAETLYTIENNLANTLDIDHLAAAVNLSKSHFIRLFNQQTGFTPTNYILHHRIQQAQMLFIEGKRSIKEVALSVGYDNTSYFGRIFKMLTELSPSEFIRQNRGSIV